MLGHLGSRRGGLTSREAARRLQQYGLNRIERHKGPSELAELVRQFTHPLALLLWAAAGLAVLGNNATLAVAIVTVIVINAVLAFFQEAQAERATEALSAYLAPRATVRRDRSVVEIDAEQLVPGDIVVLQEGDRLSADIRLVSGDVDVDMAALTGESDPVTRRAGVARPMSSILDTEDLAFSGTLCTEGEAEGVVYATGMGTQLGRIASLSQRVRPEVSPLQRQVNRASWLIAAIAVASGVVFFVVGISLVGLSLTFALTAAIGILVGNVPEGLLPTITLSLADGVRRLARRGALVKRLTAVETLGSTDVVCTDKTGTLTEGRMRVRHVWTQDGELTLGNRPLPSPSRPLRALAETATWCNNATVTGQGVTRHVTGDPGEVALLLAAEDLGQDLVTADASRSERRRTLFAFDRRVKRMTTVDEEADGRTVAHSKGAPLEVLDRCASIEGADGVRPLTDEDRSRIAGVVDGYARRGLRVLALARRECEAGSPVSRAAVESDLQFLGLVALEDPLRAGVPESVAHCREAGIRIIVVTGDYGPTAEAIAREAGIVSDTPTVVTGEQIEAMPQAELDRLLHETPELIVARSNPETKLHMVDALKAEGHTAAMTGDGVNDAPALRRADIGVAMGASGTDVAREAATMVLTDDDFTSIVAAVEEGRVVYDNVRKFITYIFTHAPAEALPFVLFAAFGAAIPLPILPLQILAIDLGTDTLPALALGREPKEPGVMTRAPRPRQSGIIQRSMLARAWLRMGMIEAFLALGGFFFVLLTAGWHLGAATGIGQPLHEVYVRATTMTWAGIVAGQVGAAFAARTSRASLASIGIFTNRHLMVGIGFAIAFAAIVIYAPPFQHLFHTAALGPSDLALLATFPFVVWGSDEIHRALLRHRDGGSAPPAPLRRSAEGGVGVGSGAPRDDRDRGRAQLPEGAVLAPVAERREDQRVEREPGPEPDEHPPGGVEHEVGVARPADEPA